jgi:thioredoxin 1
MPSFQLEQTNRADLAQALNGDVWIIACLCAAWCDVCTSFRPNFEQLAAQHPDKRFVWVDIEDQADIVGDIDVDNFPTLLIQHADTVAFFGTVLPDASQVNRLLRAQTGKSFAELLQDAQSTPEHRQWQLDCNLRERLKEALDL